MNQRGCGREFKPTRWPHASVIGCGLFDAAQGNDRPVGGRESGESVTVVQSQLPI